MSSIRVKKWGKAICYQPTVGFWFLYYTQSYERTGSCINASVYEEKRKTAELKVAYSCPSTCMRARRTRFLMATASCLPKGELLILTGTARACANGHARRKCSKVEVYEARDTAQMQLWVQVQRLCLSVVMLLMM